MQEILASLTPIFLYFGLGLLLRRTGFGDAAFADAVLFDLGNGIALTLAIRVLIGMAAGIGLAMLMGLSGTTFTVVALCAAAPVGFNALTFASLAKLDTELAANILSISIFLGVLYVPVLMCLAN
jgi:predicted permease